MITETSSHPKYQAPFLICFAVGLLLSGMNLVFGELNQDEGWYLYAAKLVSQGLLPYRDFAFTQGPVMPFVYSFFDPVVYLFGLGGGRYVTIIIGLAGAFIASRIASRLGGRAAGFITLCLTLLNVYQSYFSTVVKTYSLSIVIICAGFYMLSRLASSASGFGTILWPALAGAFLAFAAGTRLSLGILLPVVGLWLLFYRAHWGRYSWLWFGLGGSVALAVVFLPLYQKAPEGLRFGLIEYHTLREAGNLASTLVYKAGFVSRVVQAYFVAFVLLAGLGLAKWCRPFAGSDTGYHDSRAFNLIRLIWFSVLAATLVHLAAPFPYDDYQVPVFPLLAIALGVSWSYALRAWSGMGYRWQQNVEPADPPSARWFIWSLLLISIASSFSSQINQDWVIAGRDRIWWKVKDQPALLQLREVGRELQAMAPHGILLTQDIYLAVEARLDVPIGWEMGPFGLYPEFTVDQARKLRLRNVEMMARDIATSCAEVAAISGYGLSIASPDVVPLDQGARGRLLVALHERYEPYKTIPRFGQAGTPLEIYRLKPAEVEHHQH